MINIVKGFSLVSKAEMYVFLELSCFFYNPMDIGNLISGSSAFSKSSWNTWKFSVYVLSKPSLENFEHYFDSEWNEYNCAIVWTFFGIAFLWVVMKADFLQSCGHCWVFQICWHIHVGSDQIHLDRIEPLLCIISSSLILTALSFALASVLQLSSVRFSCSLSIPTDRMWAPHPGEQVHQCDETRPCHKPSSCPPLAMT